MGEKTVWNWYLNASKMMFELLKVPKDQMSKEYIDFFLDNLNKKMPGVDRCKNYLYQTIVPLVKNKTD